MPPTPPDSAPIAFIARQAGTAAAFEPLMEALNAQGKGHFCAALGDARIAWAPRTDLCATSFAELAPALKDHPLPSVLVTGTSTSVEDDALSWAWARERDIPTIAFVDSWVNYIERFRVEGQWANHLPDCVACIDEAAVMRLVDAGLPVALIADLGSPVFDGLADRRRSMPPLTDGLEVLFASQPLAGRGHPAAWDEHRALKLILDTLGRRSGTLPITLRIRLHPAEVAHTFDALLARWSPPPNVHVLFGGRRDRHDAVSDAHLVLGIVSLLMVEAQWLGRPVISVQPGGLEPSDLLDLNGIQAVHTSDELLRVLDQLLESPPKLPDPPAPSIPRWLETLEEYESFGA